jgi:putative NADPH-quinone reductase
MKKKVLLIDGHPDPDRNRFQHAARGRFPRRLLLGKSARLVVTMGMPSLFFQLIYRAHGTKAVERNILSFYGINPVRTTLIGGLGNMPARQRTAWLKKLESLGGRGA